MKGFKNLFNFNYLLHTPRWYLIYNQGVGSNVKLAGLNVLRYRDVEMDTFSVMCFNACTVHFHEENLTKSNFELIEI